MYLQKLFDKERNVLIAYFNKKVTPMSKKVVRKAPLIKHEQIELILKTFLVYKNKEAMDKWYDH